MSFAEKITTAKCLWFIAPTLILAALLWYALRPRSETVLEAGGTTILELRDGRNITGQQNVPSKKYPYGFPIEILDNEIVKQNDQEIIIGYCRWHPEADSLVGGKVAVVPVALYEMDIENKKLIYVYETITHRSDGYFVLPIPSRVKKHSIGVKIERAENCPERFKQHIPRKKTKQPREL